MASTLSAAWPWSLISVRAASRTWVRRCSIGNRRRGPSAGRLGARGFVLAATAKYGTVFSGGPALQSGDDALCAGAPTGRQGNDNGAVRESHGGGSVCGWSCGVGRARIGRVERTGDAGRRVGGRSGGGRRSHAG